MQLDGPIHHIPHLQNPNFTGRQAILQQMSETFNAGKNSVTTQSIVGLGGVGKTQLALAYCYTHLDAYDLIYWLSADSEPSLGESMMALAHRLKLIAPNVADQKAAVQALLHWLSQTNQCWLLVYDNADLIEPKQLTPFLPHTGNGCVLITSHNLDWHGLGQVLELGLFTLDEAVNFLIQRGGTAAQEGGEQWAKAEVLAKKLDRFPLALEHAAAYMAARGSSYAAYHKLFTTRQTELWARAELPDSHHAIITTTWELAFNEVKKMPGAVDLLNLCCFLDPEGIPLDLIQQVTTLGAPREMPLQTVVTDELALDDAIRVLQRYSFMQRIDDKLTMHQLVQDVALRHMGEEHAHDWVEVAIDLLTNAYRYDQHDMSTWAASSDLLPHLTKATDLAECYGCVTNNVAYLNNEVGYYVKSSGNYANAQPFFKRALTIREKVLGPDHPDTAVSLNNLGTLLRTMGDLTTARPYYEQALAINGKVLGPDHPHTASSLNNLGGLLQAMGDLTAARPFYERALTINEKVLGPDHPHTARSLNNLGSLLRTMGDLTAARPYYQRALAIWEKVLGPNHPDTASSLNNLGFLLKAMGDLTAARPFYERALAINEKVLGPDHPHTASSLNNLGSLLQAMGNLTAARPLLERTLAIREKVLSLDHPDTARSLNNLGFLLKAMGDLTAARPFYERALTINEKILGPGHPHTATSLNNLGSLWYESGKSAKAAPYFKRAYKIRLADLGDAHPDTAASIWWLGVTAEVEGNKAKARSAYTQAHAIFERALGAEHPTTKQVLSFLNRLAS